MGVHCFCRAPAFPSDLACSRDLGVCHGRACSEAVSMVQPRYLRKSVGGYGQFLAIFRPYTPAVFYGSHIPRSFPEQDSHMAIYYRSCCPVCDPPTSGRRPNSSGSPRICPNPPDPFRAPNSRTSTEPFTLVPSPRSLQVSAYSPGRRINPHP